jgi:hypothetical protein
VGEVDLGTRARPGHRSPAPSPTTGRTYGRAPRVIDLRTADEIEASQRRRVRRRGLLAIVTLALLQFGDVITTDALAGHAEELNPIADYFLQRGTLLPVKLAIIGVLGVVLSVGWRHIRPRFVTIMWAAVGVYGIVVISNAVQILLVDGL